MRKISFVVLVTLAMVAGSFKPCDAKPHEVQICQYTANDDNAIVNSIDVAPTDNAYAIVNSSAKDIVIVFVSHDVLDDVYIIAEPDVLNHDAETQITLLSIPEQERQQRLGQYVYKNDPLHKINWDNLLKHQHFRC